MTFSLGTQIFFPLNKKVIMYHRVNNKNITKKSFKSENLKSYYEEIKEEKNPK